jgi:hypothetical protein
MKRVCNLIEAYIPKCEPYKLRAYASYYAILCPLGKQLCPDPKILNDVDFRILNAWIDGDKRIPEIEAYSIIGRHLKEVQVGLKSWYQRKQAEYFSEIDKNAQFAELSPLENYRILNALWNDSIWSNYPDCTYSRDNIVFMNYEEALCKLDTETLREYYLFYSRYTYNEPAHRIKWQREAAILAELCKRSDLDEYDRKGYELDRQAMDQHIAEAFEMEIANIADRLSTVGKNKESLAALSGKFEAILTDMFDELPDIVDADDDKLGFKSGSIVAPISNEALFQIVNIHFFLWNSEVPYDEFIFTNALNELEQRTNNGDAVAHDILAHYDELYHKHFK